MRADETIRRRLYERDGVTEYWVVDPDIDAIRVYRREGSAFAHPVELTRGSSDVLTTPLLPGVTLLSERIFRDRGPAPTSA